MRDCTVGGLDVHVSVLNRQDHCSHLKNRKGFFRITIRVQPLIMAQDRCGQIEELLLRPPPWLFLMSMVAADQGAWQDYACKHDFI